ncbi:MAG: N-acyl-D-amino-acid deacylase family protein [Gemmatimonadaceae bacterium]
MSFRRVSFALVAVVCTADPLAARAQASVDVLIRGGRVMDGSGSPGRTADVGIRGDRIVFVGDASRERLTGTRTIAANGMVVAPGFIDPHTHTFGDLQGEHRERRQNAAYLMQGVTTVITGNDGGGPIDVGEQLAKFGRDSIGTNAALFVGFGTVRGRVQGSTSAPATPAQVQQMRLLVARGMEGGALGLSTGLYYAPQSYATTDEVISLAREAASRGGVYDSHLRDESSYTIGLVGAVAEAIRIGKEAGLPVHIAHIKALGVDVWGRSDSVIALIQAARAAGQRVTADQYPYTASGSGVGASLLPRWAEAGGRDSLRLRVADAPTQARLLADMRENLRRRNGARSLLITESGRQDLAGKTLEQVAAERGVEPVIAALDIVLSGDASVASFNMNEDDIAKFMTQEFVFTGSDGSSGHPRKYGTYPKKLREYVMEKHLLTLETFVKRSSADVARAFGIVNRGELRIGAFADVVIFDPAAVRDRSTYAQPALLAEGMGYVLVNGTLAVEQGRLTSALAGRGLKRGVE